MQALSRQNERATKRLAVSHLLNGLAFNEEKSGKCAGNARRTLNPNSACFLTRS
jgi:hypothetical protein